MRFAILSAGVFLISSCSSSPNQKPIDLSNDTPRSLSSNDPVCSLSDAKIVATYRPDSPPKYFFKPAGAAGNEITYVGFDDKRREDQNYLFNVRTNQITAIPGNYDPIGLFGKDLISVPLDNGHGALEMAFFDVRELRKHGVNTAPLLPPDPALKGRYQSLGVLSSHGPITRFRIFTDGSGGGEFRDFEVNFSTQPALLRPLGAKKILCPEKRDAKEGGYLRYKIPMISKDGTSFSAFDLDRQEMKLFRINAESGRCTEVKARPIGTGDIGKLDFSPNRSQVAFHYSDRDLDVEGGELTFGSPKLSWHLRGAVYDLRTNAYVLLPYAGKDSNTYYPAFLPNGNVLALQMRANGNKTEFEFIEINLHGAKQIQGALVDQLRSLKPEQFVPYQWISQKWMDRCTTWKTSSPRANRLFSVLSLNPDQCEALLKAGVENGEFSKNEVLKAEVEHVCEGLSR